MRSTFKLTEKDYRYLFENSNDAMWVHDLNGNFLDANKAFEKLSGRSIQDWFDKNVTELITPETLAYSKELKRKFLAGEFVDQPYEQKFIMQDGTARTIQMSTSPVIINGEIKAFQHVGRDITETKHAEELLARIIDSLPIATFVIDNNHIVTHWNVAMQALTGIPRDDIIGTDTHWKAFYQAGRLTMADAILDNLSSDTLEKLYQGKCKKAPWGDDLIEGEAFYTPPDNQGKWLLFSSCTLRNERGENIGAIEMIRDITEEKSLQENMRFFTQLILRAQEDERKRIARELHDDTASSMLLLIQQLDSLGTNPELQVSETTGRQFENIRTQALSVLDEIRQCAQHLRPRILDDLGLLAAIEWMADNTEKQSGIHTEVHITGKERNFPMEYQLLLFRIVQETLSNIRRHSKATQATVNLEYAEDKLNVNVIDNGNGFKLPERIEDLATSGNLGLMGMSERTRLLGGSLNVNSQPGQGTEIYISIPYHTGGRFSSHFSM